MEVTTLPNRFRPGVGLAPARVAQRPWLPQHARLCPVLEAGSALGYLVYPPLRADEAFQVSYVDRKYQLTYVRETGLIIQVAQRIESTGEARNSTRAIPVVTGAGLGSSS